MDLNFTRLSSVGPTVGRGLEGRMENKALEALDKMRQKPPTDR